MDLGEYLKSESITAAEFARRIGASRSIVIRWVKRERTPRPDAMKRISAATGGRVGAADFFDAPTGEAA